MSSKGVLLVAPICIVCIVCLSSAQPQVGPMDSLGGLSESELSQIMAYLGSGAIDFSKLDMANGEEIPISQAYKDFPELASASLGGLQEDGTPDGTIYVIEEIVESGDSSGTENGGQIQFAPDATQPMGEIRYVETVNAPVPYSYGSALSQYGSGAPTVQQTMHSRPGMYITEQKYVSSRRPKRVLRKRILVASPRKGMVRSYTTVSGQYAATQNRERPTSSSVRVAQMRDPRILDYQYETRKVPVPQQHEYATAYKIIRRDAAHPRI